uniref:BACK domain-containing protein n=1 Tax=Tetranychus urticae TaxID=32264 RepID=T1K6P2_TETUR
MIYSEYQIFESIMKWVNHKKDSRLQTLPHLLSYVQSA